MRRVSRLQRSGDLLIHSPINRTPSPYLCSVCRDHAASFSTSTSRRERAKGTVPFTENLRRRIWGTDRPPGQEDPYGKESAFDKSRKRQDILEETEKTESKTSPPVLDANYEPATTWDGLEHVGGFGGWWKENWDPDHQFKGFLPAERATETYEITAALHRALVEVFILKQAGKPLSEISTINPGEDMTSDVQIVPSLSGATLQFNNVPFDQIVASLISASDETAVKSDPAEAEEDVAADRSTVDSVFPAKTTPDETTTKEAPTESEADVAADRSTEDPLADAGKLLKMIEYQHQVESWDPIWRTVSLEDPELKFAVLKRTLQLTGIRVSDSAITSIHEVESLLDRLVTPPKSRRLVDALVQRENLVNLPNVQIYERRVTPIDREKSVGRWKVIEQELEKRGLPTTGHS